MVRLLLFAPAAPPMINEPLLVRVDPAPVTRTELFLAVAVLPMPKAPALMLLAVPPLAMTKLFDEPAFPAVKTPVQYQTEPAPVTSAELAMAVELEPMMPCATLVNTPPLLISR